MSSCVSHVRRHCAGAAAPASASEPAPRRCLGARQLPSGLLPDPHKQPGRHKPDNRTHACCKCRGVHAEYWRMPIKEHLLHAMKGLPFQLLFCMCERCAGSQRLHSCCFGTLLLPRAGSAPHKEPCRGQPASPAAADWREPQHAQQCRATAHEPADDWRPDPARAGLAAWLLGPGPGPAQQQPPVGERGRQWPEERMNAIDHKVGTTSPEDGMLAVLD